MRTFARIHRSHLKRNFESIRGAAGPSVEILAVIKADAYGHGACEVAQTLIEAGASQFAVACMEEGIELRAAGIRCDIVILGGLTEGQEATASEFRLTPVIHNACQLRNWQKQAIRDQQQLRYHLEVDTGMNRLGLQITNAAQLAHLIAEASALQLAGIATHLASAEDFADEQTSQQQERFAALVGELRRSGIRPRYLHQANSATIAYRPAMDCTMVRPGLALYGYLSPAHGVAPEPSIQVTPVLEWKTRILTVREVAAGGRLGYYGRYRAAKAMRAGVLPIGYADGFDRRMSEGGEVLVDGVRCAVLGLVSMDLTIIDLTPVPQAQAGDEVTLIGPGLDAQVMADRRGTIAYEVLCGIGKRVPRVYCD